MRILNVNSSIDLKSGGGTAERTHQMSRALALEGVECTVLTLNIGLDAARIESVKPAVVVTLDCLWRRFYLPKGGGRTISQLVKDADVVHLMGHWSVLNALVYVAALRAGKPYAVCPAGALPLFGRSALLKRVYNFFVGKAIIRNASAWIAVTASEFPHFESYGVESSKVTVISNGVNKVDFSPASYHPPVLARPTLPDAPFILFMGRLNQIKGPDLLLDAFALVSERLPDHQLVFAGPDGGMLDELCVKKVHSGLAHRVHFLGHVDGEVKSGAYRFARLLVVPSRQEAMSIVALEAGVCGTPVLLTDQCGFDEIAAIDPRLVVPATIEGLAAGLLELLENSDDLEQIGQRIKAFVQTNYAWTTIITQYIDLYLQLVGPSS